jgi:hypothetical protein
MIVIKIVFSTEKVLTEEQKETLKPYFFRTEIPIEKGMIFWGKDYKKYIHIVNFTNKDYTHFNYTEIGYLNNNEEGFPIKTLVETNEWHEDKFPIVVAEYETN